MAKYSSQRPLICLSLILGFLLFGSGFLWALDRLIMNDGTVIECYVLSEVQADSVIINKSLLRGIVEKQTIAKSLIKEIQYDDGAKDPVFQLQLPPRSRPVTYYDELIRQQIKPWLARYPRSSLQERVKQIEAMLVEERDKVAAGQQRDGDKWLTAAQTEELRPDQEAEEFLVELKATIQALDFIKFKEMALNFTKHRRAEVYPILVKTGLEGCSALAETLRPESFTTLLQKRADFYLAEKERIGLGIAQIVNEPPVPFNQVMTKSDDLVEINGVAYLATDVDNVGNAKFAPYYRSTTSAKRALRPEELDFLNNQLQSIEENDALLVKIKSEIKNIGSALGKTKQDLERLEKNWQKEPLAQMERVLASLKILDDKAKEGDIDFIAINVEENYKVWAYNTPTRRWLLRQSETWLADLQEKLAAQDLAGAYTRWQHVTRLLKMLKGKSLYEAELTKVAEKTPEIIADLVLVEVKKKFATQEFDEFLRDRPQIDKLVAGLEVGSNLKNAIKRDLLLLDKEMNLAQAQKVTELMQSKNYDMVIDYKVSHWSESMQRWHDIRRTKAEENIAASKKALEEISPLLWKVKFGDADLALTRARSLWPSNPETESHERNIQMVKGSVIGGGLALIVVIVLICWQVMATWGDALRYKWAKKKEGRKIVRKQAPPAKGAVPQTDTPDPQQE
jgi:hypothetical protein